MWSHVDRVEALARAVAYFQQAMVRDVDQAPKATKNDEIEAEIEDFLEGFNQTKYRRMRIDGVRVPVWSSQNGSIGRQKKAPPSGP